MDLGEEPGQWEEVQRQNQEGFDRHVGHSWLHVRKEDRSKG